MRPRGRKTLDGLKDDLHDHLARQTEENVARGMTPEEARRQAFLALGNLTMIEEDTRAVWVWRWLDALRQDVRYALRTFRRDWVFSTVALLTLTLGIGAATAIFSIVYAVALKPLPYGDAAGLVQVSNNDRAFLSIEEYEALVAQASALSGVAAAKVEMSATPGPDGDINIPDYACTLNLFDVLGVRPELGRTFAPVDADQHVAVLDHEWWMHQIGGDPAVLGRSITLDDTPYQVIGVMPGGFRFPFRRPANVWIPADAEARAHSGGNWPTVGRMRRSASIADARAELAVISGRFAAEDPQRYAHMALTVEPLLDAVVGVATRTRLLVLLGAVGCVLVIACANVASLLLTRSRSRVRELAVRTAIGAGRGRLLRQLLTEAILTAVLGGAAGIVVAHWMLGAIVGLIPSSVPRLGSIALDDTVLLVACLLSLASGLATGLMPAWLASRPDVHHALKDGAPMTTAPGASRAGALFVFAETSLALVLLIGAGLMIHSFDLLNQIDPGFAASHLVTIDLKGHPPPARIRELLQRARTLPGVRDVSGADDVPFEGGGARTTIDVQGRPQPPFDLSNTATEERVLPGYFHMLGIGLLRGREFSDQDVNGAPLVALINEAAAKK